MHQENASALSGLASVEVLEALLAARHLEDSSEAMMTFEAFEVEPGHAVRGLENELKSADLARYDVDAIADAMLVDGQEWRKCLAMVAAITGVRDAPQKSGMLKNKSDNHIKGSSIERYSLVR